MSKDKHLQIALFRYQVIAPLLNLSQDQPLSDEIKKLTEQFFTPPDGVYPRQLSFKTIEEWLYTYRKEGLYSLKPVTRKDSGASKTIVDNIAKEVTEILTQRPHLSGPNVIKELVARGITQQNQISLSAFYRFRRAQGLKKQQKKKDTFRAFAFEYPLQCYQTDVLYGPKLPTKEGKLKQTYLIAVIDDCTRVIAHGQFYFEQKLPTVLDTLKQAIMKRGIPQRLYLDNAFVFRSSHLLRIAATIGMQIIHSKPYRPQGRAKIERFFRTVRAQFLQRLDKKVIDMENLNTLFWAWLEGEYHNNVHSGLLESPLSKWLRLADFTKPLPESLDLDMVFMHQANRRVAIDSTFQLKKQRFEAPLHLAGERIKVHYDSGDLRKVYLSLNNNNEGVAYPLDLEANSRVRREKVEVKKAEKEQSLISLDYLKTKMEEKNGQTDSPTN